MRALVPLQLLESAFNPWLIASFLSFIAASAISSLYGLDPTLVHEYERLNALWCSFYIGCSASALIAIAFSMIETAESDTQSSTTRSKFVEWLEDITASRSLKAAFILAAIILSPLWQASGLSPFHSQWRLVAEITAIGAIVIFTAYQLVRFIIWLAFNWGHS